MPSWRKVIVSGSDATLNSLTTPAGTINNLTASFAISASYAVTASVATTSLNTSDILVYVKNTSGASIPKGAVVRITGATGDNALISTASWDSDGLSANTLGILNETIANDAFGYAMTEGKLLGIDTQTFTAGQLLFLGPTGSIIGSEPIPPKHAVRLGQVLRVQSLNGSMYVRIDNGYELDELHNVLIISGSDGDLLVASGSNDNGKKLYINSKQLTGSYGLTGSLSITGSTTTDLVRITQTGTGAAFVVEDSTNPDSSPFVVSNAGNVGIGLTTPLEKLHVSGSIRSDIESDGNFVVLQATGQRIHYIKRVGQRLQFTSNGANTYDVQFDSSNASVYILSGSVGIGTTTPNAKLDVSGSAIITGSLTVKGTGAVGAVLDTDTSSDFQSTRLFFKMSGSSNDVSMRNLSGSLLVATQATAGGSSGTVTAMFISSSGNVAIGNTQPTLGLLQVGGNVYATSFTGSGLQITGSTTTDLVRITQTGTGNAFVVEDSTNPDSTPFVITAAGNVGIGTNAPSELLSIQASDVGTNLANDGVTLNIANSNSTANNISSISFGQSGAGGNGFSRIGVIYKSRTSGAEAQDLFFGTIDAGAFGERMRITSDGNIGIGTTAPNAKIDVSGSAIITGSLNVTQNITGSRLLLSASTGTNSGSVLTVYGSGSAQPVFTVQGSQGELFSVTDSLSGSLFSVNDISGLPILEVFSDNTTLIGSYQDPMLITTTKLVTTASGAFTIYSLPTASYDTAFFEYSIRSGSNARAGSIMAIQSASAVNFTETTTTDFGSTAGLAFTVLISGANMLLTGSATTSGWTLKTIIRSI
jgi:hypothetical protein